MLLSRHDPALRVEHHLVVGRAGEDLLVVLGEAAVGVRSEVARHRHVPVVAVAERLERARIQDLGMSEADGEHVTVEPVDHISDVGDVAPGVRAVVFLAVGEYHNRLHSR
jgi:hypothetical protein